MYLAILQQQQPIKYGGGTAHSSGIPNIKPTCY